MKKEGIIDQMIPLQESITDSQLKIMQAATRAKANKLSDIIQSLGNRKE